MKRCFTTNWEDYRHELNVSDTIWRMAFYYYMKIVACPVASREAGEVLSEFRERYPFPEFWEFAHGEKNGKAATSSGVVLDRYIREDRPSIRESDVLALCQGK